MTTAALTADLGPRIPNFARLVDRAIEWASSPLARSTETAVAPWEIEYLDALAARLRGEFEQPVLTAATQSDLDDALDRGSDAYLVFWADAVRFLARLAEKGFPFDDRMAELRATNTSLFEEASGRLEEPAISGVGRLVDRYLQVSEGIFASVGGPRLAAVFAELADDPGSEEDREALRRYGRLAILLGMIEGALTDKFDADRRLWLLARLRDGCLWALGLLTTVVPLEQREGLFPEIDPELAAKIARTLRG